MMEDQVEHGEATGVWCIDVRIMAPDGSHWDSHEHVYWTDAWVKTLALVWLEQCRAESRAPVFRVIYGYGVNMWGWA